MEDVVNRTARTGVYTHDYASAAPIICPAGLRVTIEDPRKGGSIISIDRIHPIMLYSYTLFGTVYRPEPQRTPLSEYPTTELMIEIGRRGHES